MSDPIILRGLLEAYISGDVLARKVLLDFLEEEGDNRLESVRAEDLKWDALAKKLAQRRSSEKVGYMRFLIECARVGSTTQPQVVAGVRELRRRWLRDLFPEVDLSGS